MDGIANAKPLPANGARASGREASRRDAAVALLRQPTEPPLTALRALGFSSLSEVATFVAQYNVPRMELDGEELSPDLARLVPLDMAECKRFVPTFSTDSELTIATPDPTRVELFDWLSQQLKRTVINVIATWPEIERAIDRLYEPLEVVREKQDEEEAVSAQALEEATSIADRLIARAVDLRASDIHIEALEKETVVRFRIDGALRLAETLPASAHAALVSRVKVMSQLDISERQVPQDGRIKLRRAKGDIDLRVSVLPTYFGEKVVCRVLDNTRACMPLAELGFDPDQLEVFQKLIRSPWGMVLVTGPTGNGKSMTLYDALNAVRSPELNIVTVEDPVEYQLPGHQSGSRQPQARSHFRGRAAVDSSAGSQRRARRRDSRSRNRPDRLRGRSHRAPRAVVAAHQRRAERHHPADGDGHRAVPRRPCAHRRGRPAARSAHLRGLQGALRPDPGGARRHRRPEAPGQRHALQGTRLRRVLEDGLPGPDRGA